MSELRPRFNGKQYNFTSFGIHRAEDLANAWKTLHTFGQKVAMFKYVSSQYDLGSVPWSSCCRPSLNNIDNGIREAISIFPFASILMYDRSAHSCFCQTVCSIHFCFCAPRPALHSRRASWMVQKLHVRCPASPEPAVEERRGS